MDTSHENSEPFTPISRQIRLGNNVYIHHGDHIEPYVISVELSDLVAVDEVHDIEITGIPLTEEWLTKFGFTKNKEQFGIRIDEYAFLNIYTDTFRYGLFDISSGEEFKSWDNLIQNVHELQNLFFALTGEELTIK